MIRVYVKRLGLALLTLLCLLGAACTLGVLWPHPTVAPAQSRQPIAITNITVIDIERGLAKPGQTVLIAGSRIRAVGHGASTPIPPNAEMLDGTGKFIMPALWDMHTHITKVTPLLDLPLYIRYGVTNVRDMLSCPAEGDPFIACPDELRALSEEAAAGRLVGPRIQGTASFMANGPGILEPMPDLPEYFGVATPEQARAFVRHFAGSVDAIKVYNNISRDAYFALVDEAQRHGLPVVGHRPRGVSAIEAAQNQKSIEHARFILHESFPGSKALRDAAGTPVWRENRRRMLDEHDPQMAEAIFAAMVDNGTWYVPTHLTRRTDAFADDPLVREDPLLRYLHPLLKWQWMEDVNGLLDEAPSPEARQTYRDFYKKGLTLTGAAHDAGVKVLVGTDSIVAGATVHAELQELVKAGLTPAEALRSAIVLPAQYFELEHQYGHVAPGMVADLILLGANPLEDIRHTLDIDTVIFNGNVYNPDKLDEIDRHVQKQARSWTVACKILWEFIKNPAAY